MASLAATGRCRKASQGVRVGGAGRGRQLEQLARPHDDFVVGRQRVRGRAEVDALRLALRQRLAAGARELAALDVDLVVVHLRARARGVALAVVACVCAAASEASA